jgi:hypothetical protein
MNDGHPQSQSGVSESEACCSISKQQDTEKSCPSCGNRGRHVDRITLKALLSSEALTSLGSDEYKFCSTKSCDTVYFAPESIFRTRDIVTRVWQKSDDPSVPVCYCFGHSEDSIRAEAAQAGNNAVLERIKRLVSEGRCACEVRNPQGTCCLGNVSLIVARVQRSQPAQKEQQ